MGLRSVPLVRILALGLIVAGCAAQPSPRAESASSGQSAAPSGAAAAKHLTVAVLVEPPSLYYQLIPPPIRASPGGVLDFVQPGLVAFDERGGLQPLLVEAVPSIENGLWRLGPDGTMETTWRLRERASWHDGTPVTADDLVFTIAMVQDRELGVFRNKSFDLIREAVAVDARTATLRWDQPFIDADKMFTTALATPAPKHLLSRAYTESKLTFLEHPYWSSDFVGLGAYRLKQWDRGSHMVLGAYDGFALGRAKIDEIEVRFIPDGNTLLSNVLSGSVDLTMRQTVSLDQALQIRDQWQNGEVMIGPDGWAAAYVQFMNTNPPIVLNPQYRRAMLHAIDRQQLVDSLMAGKVSVAYCFIPANTEDYRDIEQGITRYDYDPRRAAQLVEGLGYTRGADGMFRDGTGQPLAMEVRASAQRDLHVKMLFPIVDAWQRLGVAAEPVVIPAQLASNLEHQASFPSFLILREPNGFSRLPAYQSGEARVPERNFVGANVGRYMSPSYDALVDRFMTTIPRAERMAVGTQIIRELTEQLPALPLFYDAMAQLVSKKLQGFPPPIGAERSRDGWNVHTWDLR